MSASSALELPLTAGALPGLGALVAWPPALWWPETGVEPWLVALLLLGGFAAGWIDAVVGGGGLIQLPLVLMLPGITPVQALAVNKCGSVCGTAVSTVTFHRRTPARIRPALPMAAVAFAGSFGGASLAAALPTAVFKPVVLTALVGVLIFTVARPQAGRVSRPERSAAAQAWISVGIGLVLGAYDGLLGPGTGSFLIIAMVTLLGFDFLRASTRAKVTNLATNLGAICFFALHGSILWGLGLLLGAGNMLGGLLGARSAVARGSGFVRAVFLAVVTVLILKTGWDVIREISA